MTPSRILLRISNASSFLSSLRQNEQEQKQAAFLPLASRSPPLFSTRSDTLLPVRRRQGERKLPQTSENLKKTTRSEKIPGRDFLLKGTLNLV